MIRPRRARLRLAAARDLAALPHRPGARALRRDAIDGPHDAACVAGALSAELAAGLPGAAPM